MKQLSKDQLSKLLDISSTDVYSLLGTSETIIKDSVLQDHFNRLKVALDRLNVKIKGTLNES
jgi:hypothetical protein